MQLFLQNLSIWPKLPILISTGYTLVVLSYAVRKSFPKLWISTTNLCHIHSYSLHCCAARFRLVPPCTRTFEAGFMFKRRAGGTLVKQESSIHARKLRSVAAMCAKHSSLRPGASAGIVFLQYLIWGFTYSCVQYTTRGPFERLSLRAAHRPTSEASCSTSRRWSRSKSNALVSILVCPCWLPPQHVSYGWFWAVSLEGSTLPHITH